MSTAGHTTVQGEINYVGDMSGRPCFHANDRRLDRVNLDSRTVAITDARDLVDPPTLSREGFALVTHATAVSDFRDIAEVERIYPDETRRLIQDLTGADVVVISGPPILRFGERSQEAGSRDNSRAARLVHIDTSDATAAQFAQRVAPSDASRRIRRVAQHNIWRTFSAPPQDVPLAVCDARSITREDLVPADANFDRDGKIVLSFEALLLRYASAHRWMFFRDMTRDEALVFKRHDTDPSEPHFVPHSAFTDQRVPAGTEPRASVEIRTIAYWYV
jgi:hypothetical protein